MLAPVKKLDRRRSRGSFAIVASTYNARYVDAMVAAAQAELKKARVKTIRVIRVPGAFEIPVVVARLAAASSMWSGIICLGVILRGQTGHAQQIGNAVTASLAQLQIQHALPIIHEVLLLENEAQAKVRCLDKQHNRGTEAAQTALEMERVMSSL